MQPELAEGNNVPKKNPIIETRGKKSKGFTLAIFATPALDPKIVRRLADHLETTVKTLQAQSEFAKNIRVATRSDQVMRPIGTRRKNT